ncbi:MAG: hypothetical protein ACR2MP_19745 [Streptosporangiaceae bacterium]
MSDATVAGSRPVYSAGFAVRGCAAEAVLAAAGQDGRFPPVREPGAQARPGEVMTH